MVSKIGFRLKYKLLGVTELTMSAGMTALMRALENNQGALSVINDNLLVSGAGSLIPILKKSIETKSYLNADAGNNLGINAVQGWWVGIIYSLLLHGKLGGFLDCLKQTSSRRSTQYQYYLVYFLRVSVFKEACSFGEVEAERERDEKYPVYALSAFLRREEEKLIPFLSELKDYYLTNTMSGVSENMDLQAAKKALEQAVINYYDKKKAKANTGGGFSGFFGGVAHKFKNQCRTPLQVTQNKFSSYFDIKGDERIGVTKVTLKDSRMTGHLMAEDIQKMLNFFLGEAVGNSDSFNCMIERLNDVRLFEIKEREHQITVEYIDGKKTQKLELIASTQQSKLKPCEECWKELEEFVNVFEKAYYIVDPIVFLLSRRASECRQSANGYFVSNSSKDLSIAREEILKVCIKGMLETPMTYHKLLETSWEANSRKTDSEHFNPQTTIMGKSFKWHGEGETHKLLNELRSLDKGNIKAYLNDQMRKIYPSLPRYERAEYDKVITYMGSQENMGSFQPDTIVSKPSISQPQPSLPGSPVGSSHSILQQTPAPGSPHLLPSAVAANTDNLSTPPNNSFASSTPSTEPGRPAMTNPHGFPPRSAQSHSSGENSPADRTLFHQTPLSNPFIYTSGDKQEYGIEKLKDTSDKTFRFDNESRKPVYLDQPVSQVNLLELMSRVVAFQGSHTVLSSQSVMLENRLDEVKDSNFLSACQGALETFREQRAIKNILVLVSIRNKIRSGSSSSVATESHYQYQLLVFQKKERSGVEIQFYSPFPVNSDIHQFNETLTSVYKRTQSNNIRYEGLTFTTNIESHFLHQISYEWGESTMQKSALLVAFCAMCIANVPSVSIKEQVQAYSLSLVNVFNSYGATLIGVSDTALGGKKVGFTSDQCFDNRSFSDKGDLNTLICQFGLLGDYGRTVVHLMRTYEPDLKQRKIAVGGMFRWRNIHNIEQLKAEFKSLALHVFKYLANGYEQVFVPVLNQKGIKENPIAYSYHLLVFKKVKRLFTVEGKNVEKETIEVGLYNFLGDEFSPAYENDKNEEFASLLSYGLWEAKRENSIRFNFIENGIHFYRYNLGLVLGSRYGGLFSSAIFVISSIAFQTNPNARSVFAQFYFEFQRLTLGTYGSDFLKNMQSVQSSYIENGLFTRLFNNGRVMHGKYHQLINQQKFICSDKITSLNFNESLKVDESQTQKFIAVRQPLLTQRLGKIPFDPIWQYDALGTLTTHRGPVPYEHNVFKGRPEFYVEQNVRDTLSFGATKNWDQEILAHREVLGLSYAQLGRLAYSKSPGEKLRLMDQWVHNDEIKKEVIASPVCVDMAKEELKALVDINGGVEHPEQAGKIVEVKFKKSGASLDPVKFIKLALCIADRGKTGKENRIEMLSSFLGNGEGEYNVHFDTGEITNRLSSSSIAAAALASSKSMPLQGSEPPTAAYLNLTPAATSGGPVDVGGPQEINYVFNTGVGSTIGRGSAGLDVNTYQGVEGHKILLTDLINKTSTSTKKEVFGRLGKFIDGIKLIEKDISSKVEVSFIDSVIRKYTIMIGYTEASTFKRQLEYKINQTSSNGAKFLISKKFQQGDNATESWLKQYTEGTQENSVAQKKDKDAKRPVDRLLFDLNQGVFKSFMLSEAEQAAIPTITLPGKPIASRDELSMPPQNEAYLVYYLTDLNEVEYFEVRISPQAQAVTCLKVFAAKNKNKNKNKEFHQLTGSPVPGPTLQAQKQGAVRLDLAKAARYGGK